MNQSNQYPYNTPYNSSINSDRSYSNPNYSSPTINGNMYNYTTSSVNDSGGFNNEYHSQQSSQSQGYNSLTNVNSVDNKHYSNRVFGSNNAGYHLSVPAMIRSNSLGILTYHIKLSSYIH